MKDILIKTTNRIYQQIIQHSFNRLVSVNLATNENGLYDYCITKDSIEKLYENKLLIKKGNENYLIIGDDLIEVNLLLPGELDRNIFAA